MKVTVPFYSIGVEDFFNALADAGDFELTETAYDTVLIRYVEDFLRAISLDSVAHISYIKDEILLLFEVNSQCQVLLQDWGIDAKSLAIKEYELEIK